ncbi:hypothetical protein [Paenibacillus donghaensis]|uniref:Uncharacterized protein n=1 Tax=Paenibacillus donghaensis TaxID=414771 RepID=A0A2Z2KCW5_9BACL|nr:hypothetical protein [Paenibacillus donghaensis]ASA20850.1 hypothetical protein B9T62_08690 [Paenibacillus donghaensis]
MQLTPLKKRRTFLIILVLVTLAYAGYQFYLYYAPRQAHYGQVETTDLGQESLGGIQLQQSIRTIEPAPTPKQDNDLYPYYTLEDETTVATEHGSDQIVLLVVYDNPDRSTHKGIHAGSSRQEVLDAYGQAFYKREEQGTSIIGYVDKENHRSLEFWLYKSKVQMIRYSVDSVTM